MANRDGSATSEALHPAHDSRTATTTMSAATATKPIKASTMALSIRLPGSGKRDTSRFQRRVYGASARRVAFPIGSDPWGKTAQQPRRPAPAEPRPAKVSPTTTAKMERAPGPERQGHFADRFRCPGARFPAQQACWYSVCPRRKANPTPPVAEAADGRWDPSRTAALWNTAALRRKRKRPLRRGLSRQRSPRRHLPERAVLRSTNRLHGTPR